MTSIIVAFFVSIVVATVVTPLVLRLATRRGLYDQPDGRKVHSRLVPRLGGIAIVIGFFAPLTGLLLVDAGITEQLTHRERQLVGLFVGGILVALLGLWDDLRGTNARQKFVVQLGVATLMWFFGYRILGVSNPFGEPFALGVFAFPVTLLWFVGVMNAVNLIDGLDGLAGGIGLISVTTLGALALMDGNVLAALMCACLAGSLVGFLFFNFNPARIFMGDTGSLFLGFVLAAFSISTQAKGSTALALAIPILVLAVPLVDTMLAIGRRVRARRNIFSADQEHIHHKLLKAGFSHRGAVLVLYGVAATLAALALVLRSTTQPIAALVLLAAGLLLFVLLRLLVGSHRRGRTLADPFGADGLRARATFDAIAARLDGATDVRAVAAALDELARATGCLAVIVLDGARPLYVYDRAPARAEAMAPVGSYLVPLAERPQRDAQAYIELRFVRDPSGDGLAELRVVLPWERVRASVAGALTRMAWPLLQEPVPEPTALREPPVLVPTIAPIPGWTRVSPPAKGA